MADSAEPASRVRHSTRRPQSDGCRLRTHTLRRTDMLSELREDEKAVVLSMHAVHTLRDDAGDVATASLLENWIDQAQPHVWFLFEITRR